VVAESVACEQVESPASLLSHTMTPSTGWSAAKTDPTNPGERTSVCGTGTQPTSTTAMPAGASRQQLSLGGKPLSDNA
jgi:hypothetical protein